jgi:hypothetical protein
MLVSYFMVKRCISWCRQRSKRKNIKPIDQRESKPTAATTTEAYLSNNEGSLAPDHKKRLSEQVTKTLWEKRVSDPHHENGDNESNIK